MAVNDDESADAAAQSTEDNLDEIYVDEAQDADNETEAEASRRPRVAIGLLTLTARTVIIIV
jgi:hypothetical protein